MPEQGGHPQAIINAQQVDKCDGLIGVFHTRLGAETPSAASGTAEEIQRVQQNGKDVKIYICKKDVPRDIIDDEDRCAEYQRLKAYRTSLYNEGLVGDYCELDDLKQQMVDHLTAWARKFLDRDRDQKKSHERAVGIVDSARAEGEGKVNEDPVLFRLFPESRINQLSRIFDGYGTRYREVVSSSGFTSGEVEGRVAIVEEFWKSKIDDFIHLGKNDIDGSSYAPLSELFEGLLDREMPLISSYGALLLFWCLGISQISSGGMGLMRRLAGNSVECGQNNRSVDVMSALHYREVFANGTERSISEDSLRKWTPVSDHLLKALKEWFTGHVGRNIEMYFELFELLVSMRYLSAAQKPLSC